MRKKTILRYNKTVIATMLNCDVRELDLFLSDEIKKAVGWQKGCQYFTDVQVYHLIKDINRLYTHAEIIRIIHPRINNIPPEIPLLQPL